MAVTVEVKDTKEREETHVSPSCVVVISGLRKSVKYDESLTHFQKILSSTETSGLVKEFHQIRWFAIM